MFGTQELWKSSSSISLGRKSRWRTSSCLFRTCSWHNSTKRWSNSSFQIYCLCWWNDERSLQMWNPRRRIPSWVRTKSRCLWSQCFLWSNRWRNGRDEPYLSLDRFLKHKVNTFRWSWWWPIKRNASWFRLFRSRPWKLLSNINEQPSIAKRWPQKVKAIKFP